MALAHLELLFILLLGVEGDAAQDFREVNWQPLALFEGDPRTNEFWALATPFLENGTRVTA